MKNERVYDDLREYEEGELTALEVKPAIDKIINEQLITYDFLIDVKNYDDIDNSVFFISVDYDDNWLFSIFCKAYAELNPKVDLSFLDSSDGDMENYYIWEAPCDREETVEEKTERIKKANQLLNFLISVNAVVDLGAGYYDECDYVNEEEAQKLIDNGYRDND